MSKKTDPVDSGSPAIENEGGAQAAESMNGGSPAIENEGGAQAAESVNSGSPAVKKEKSYEILTANSREELDKKIIDLKAKQPEGLSLISGPIAKDAFGQYVTRIDFIKKA